MSTPVMLNDKAAATAPTTNSRLSRNLVRSGAVKHTLLASSDEIPMVIAAAGTMAAAAPADGHDGDQPTRHRLLAHGEQHVVAFRVRVDEQDRPHTDRDRQEQQQLKTPKPLVVAPQDLAACRQHRRPQMRKHVEARADRRDHHRGDEERGVITRRMGGEQLVAGLGDLGEDLGESAGRTDRGDRDHHECQQHAEILEHRHPCDAIPAHDTNTTTSALARTMLSPRADEDPVARPTIRPSPVICNARYGTRNNAPTTAITTLS